MDEEENLKKIKENLTQNGNGLTLRDHQIEGLKFLLKCYTNGHGCILADEMGLGKTCQAVTFLSSFSQTQRPHIILCPLSVIDHWHKELQRFGCGQLSIVVYRGTKEERAEIRESNLTVSSSWNILLTTYELFLKDAEYFTKFKWKTLIVDEAHRLKNYNSLLYQTLLEQSIEWTLLMTGTPVQNNVNELYALISFVVPKEFPLENVDTFVKSFSDSSNTKEMAKLRKILDRFLLRRTKDVVCEDLPEKSEVVLFHGISQVQKRLYKAILVKNHEFFEQTSNEGSRQSLMNVLVQLRKCVDHPYLFEGVEPEPFEEGEHLVEASGKLVVLDALLRHLHTKGHKVLLFSQMTRILDILQDYVTYRGFNYERLDGSVRGEERFAAVKQFNENSDTFVFLLSTKAGGLGLTLTGADTVIFYDSDFNPQNDIQAAARAHRIGQDKPVKVVRLVAKHTVEEIILSRAASKLRLTEAVMGSENGKTADDKMTVAEMTEMLTYGLRQLTTDGDEVEISEEKLINILGETTNDGLWLPKKIDNKEQTPAESQVTDETSIYYFEGKDYKEEAQLADKQLLETLIDRSKKEPTSQSSRRAEKTIETLAFPKRTVKILTQEEQEERKRKREEAIEKRRQIQLEEEKRRQKEKKEKLEKFWKANDYKSSNLVEPDTEFDRDLENENIDLDDEETATRRQPFYVIGDVAHPKPRVEHSTGHTLVLHCVDNSGSWGRGGVFDALVARSPSVETAYTTCGKMKDLTLGDAHLIEIDDVERRESGRDYAVLLVGMDKRNRTQVDTSSLGSSLDRVANYIKEQKDLYSVHLPRIGYGLPKVNWYAIERLIKKHLCRRAIPTYIYYFQRKKANKRPAESSSTSESPKPKRSTTSLFEGITVLLCGFDQEQYERRQRLIVAFDGEVVKIDDISALTHIVVGSEELNENEKKLISESKLPVIKQEWLVDCFQKKILQPVQNYDYKL